LIHERLGEYEHLPILYPVGGTNICNHFKIRKGDINQGFKGAFRVYENKFNTQMVHHCYLEPHVVIAAIDISGNIVVYGSFQSPFISREQLAQVFQIPVSKIRIIVPAVGGGFGGKCTIKLEPIVVSLALKARKPVKITMSREEEFVGSTVRHPTTSYVKTGVTRDGRLLAVKEKIIWDTGAYADDGPPVASFSGCGAIGPYQIPNVWIDSCCVYTNHPVAGAFRGFGIPQVTWAMESQLDIIAEDLEIDPLEIRLKNAVEEGSISATGEVLHSVGIKESLRQVGKAVDWGKKRPSGRGVGIACMHKFAAPLETSIMIRINDDGIADIFKGATELGQGVNTILSQIAAEVLGTSVDQVSVAIPDTEFTPYDWSTVASRSTFFSGNATKHAAEDAKRQLLSVAAEMLRVSPHDLACRGGRVFVVNEPEKGASFQSIACYSRASQNGPIIGKAGFGLKDISLLDPDSGQGNRPFAFWMYATQGAEVEVDRETGEVKLLKLVAAHDVGKALNPMTCEQQIEGALVMGIGTALYEELALDSGRALNASFADYKIPRAKNVPELVLIIVEAPHKEGPFGAKGLGEPGLAPTAAAISNAIYDAIGIRIKDLPITPEKIVKALKEKARSGENVKA
jgi:carbon-monoxide dehydrogenase large subunit